MKSNILEKEKEKLEKYSAERVLEWVVDRFSSGVVFASSMGVEDQILLDMISRLNLDIPIFTLDTGRLFNENYELITESEKRYGVKIQVYAPDGVALESMVNSYGVNLFYDGEEERRRCCSVRKIEPLQRALKPHSAWICGLRKDQSVTRKGLHVVDWDSVNSMEKINPLLNWSEDEVWAYIKENNVPYNKLHDKGFASIGCACCTRAIKPGDDIRAGRWWWEQPDKKECGLHLVDGTLQRKI